MAAFFSGLKFADFLPTLSEGFGKFLSFGMNKSSANEQFERQKELADLQQKHNIESMNLSNKMSIDNALNAGIYERLSKQRAGFNLNAEGGYSPIAGASALASGQGSAPSPPQMDFGSFAQLMQNAPLVKAQADKAQAEADAIRAKTPVEIENLGSQTSLNRVNEQLAGIHVQNLPSKYKAEIQDLFANIALLEAKYNTELDTQENIQKDTQKKAQEINTSKAQENLYSQQSQTEIQVRNELKAKCAQAYAYIEWLKKNGDVQDATKDNLVKDTELKTQQTFLTKKQQFYYDDWITSNITKNKFESISAYNNARLSMCQAIVAWKNGDWFAFDKCLQIANIVGSARSDLISILAK